MEKVELELRKSLTEERLLTLREEVLQVASECVEKSPTVRERFHELFPDASDEQRQTLRRRLCARYLHSRAKSFRREVMQRLVEHKQSVSLRSKLKAAMLHEHAGQARAGKAAIPFSCDILGKLTPLGLHSHLCAVVAANPNELIASKGMTKNDMLKLLNAYGAPRVSGNKASLLQELIAAVSGHDGFTQPDPTLVCA